MFFVRWFIVIGNDNDDSLHTERDAKWFGV